MSASAAEERRELVTDYAQLRAGMLVVLSPCFNCNREHRGILVAQYRLGIAAMFGLCASCWEIRPDPHNKLGICACPVSEGRVFRVVDGLEDPAQHEAELRMDGLRARQRASAGLSPVYVSERGR